MGDSTTFQCYIYACPDDQREAALAVLRGQYQLQLDWGSGRHTGTLSLTEPYTEHVFSVGSASEVAGALEEEAPGASFVLWEDPKHEWLGDVYARTPELGNFTAECDGEGQPVYTREQIADLIRKAADAAADTTDKLLAELDKLTGGPWFDAWRTSYQKGA